MFGKKSAVKKTYNEAMLYEYAVGALGRRMRTVAELKRLMRTRVAHQDDGDALIEQVTLRLKEQRYLNDTEYAAYYSAIRRDADKFGRLRVVQELKARGVHQDVIGQAVSEAYGAVDENKLARQFVERKRLHQPKDQKEAARIFRMMVRAGFSSRAISRLLRNWSVEDETLSALEAEREQMEVEHHQEEDES
ncbi:MAG: regulatory protein RecX [Acidobacteriota bacterium]|nr:regulatory protein RecX [Acidobacteriota bacterium]